MSCRCRGEVVLREKPLISAGLMSEVDKRRKAKTANLRLKMSKLPETARPAVQYYVCLLWAYAEVRVTPASSRMMKPASNTVTT